MKRVLGLAAFGCTLTGVRCKNWTPAEETLGILPMLGQSPKPTPAPFVAEGSDLERRRAADNTCAYVSGSAGQFLLMKIILASETHSNLASRNSALLSSHGGLCLQREEFLYWLL